MNLRVNWKWAIYLALPVLLLACGSARAQLGMPRKPAVKGPWMNKSLPPGERADLVMKKMTLNEKVQLLHGMGWMTLFTRATSGPGVRSEGGSGFIPGIPHLGIPDIQMDDAAVGVAHQGRNGRYATALPSTEAEAATWAPKVAYKYGALIGTELRDMGFNMSLGGGVDLVREPRGGRTFEYQGEDPILAGTMVGQEMLGEQAQHVIGDIKHYAINDQDNGRFFANMIISKRAMRETDLLAFQIGIQTSHVGAVMCSYNMINGVYACQNDYTLHDVLDHAFGYKGFVVSDWGATHSTVKAAMAGLDMEMPGKTYFGEALKKAVEDGKVPMSRLNEMVHRILRTEFATGIVDDPPQPQAVNAMRGFKVAQYVEEQGAVLLKNADHQLPLDPEMTGTIAVIGGHANVGVLSGGGSGQVAPAGGNPVPPPPGQATGLAVIFSEWYYQRSVPLDAIRKAAPKARVEYNAGTDIASAAALAKSAKVAIVFGVQHESEGSDLPSLALPGNQNALIKAVAAANPHTIVVIESGGAVTMPWVDQVSGVLESWYPGIRGAQAIAAILFGRVNPSGKLPLTFPKSEAQLPHPVEAKQPAGPMKSVPGMPALFKMNTRVFDVHYSEGLKVGYKWFDAEHKTPLFPFGYGLSYTTFAFSGLKVTHGNALNVSVTVRNTGHRAGQEVAEIYATLPASAQEPPRRLVAWKKVELAPGESKTVSMSVPQLYLSIFNVSRNNWQLVPGTYKIWAGGSERDLPVSSTISLKGD